MSIHGLNKREMVDVKNNMQVGGCGLISIIFKEFFRVQKKGGKLSKVLESKYFNGSTDVIQGAAVSSPGRKGTVRNK